MVVKKDGRREPFSREKVLAGILRACEKRPVSREQIDYTVDKIENELRKISDEAPSKKIGELVMKHLKKLDKIAYIRFASVYRSFDDIKMFEEEVRSLKNVS
jgi:transcriptional repressor NrdR